MNQRKKQQKRLQNTLECSVAFLNGITSCSDPTDDPNGLKMFQ